MNPERFTLLLMFAGFTAICGAVAYASVPIALAVYGAGLVCAGAVGAHLIGEARRAATGGAR